MSMAAIKQCMGEGIFRYYIRSHKNLQALEYAKQHGTLISLKELL
jgi:hypothetical protein